MKWVMIYNIFMSLFVIGFTIFMINKTNNNWFALLLFLMIIFQIEYTEKKFK